MKEGSTVYVSHLNAFAKEYTLDVEINLRGLPKEVLLKLLKTQVEQENYETAIEITKIVKI